MLWGFLRWIINIFDCLVWVVSWLNFSVWWAHSHNVVYFRDFFYFVVSSFSNYAVNWQYLCNKCNIFFSPIEKQMRKNELQSRIRHLRSDNTTLTTLISHMDIEWKEVVIFVTIVLSWCFVACYVPVISPQWISLSFTSGRS